MGTLLQSLFLLILLCVSPLHAAVKSTGPVKKTKLCGNDLCTEVLFKSKITRTMETTHPHFIDVVEGNYLEIVAVKFSDRVDIMEAKKEDGTRGLIYFGAIDKGPYVEFLRNAVETKKEITVVTQDSPHVGEKSVVGHIHAELDLVRDLNVQARNYALEQKLPPPEEYPVPEPPAKGHGHSHGGHGHSHDNHGHSHTAPSPPPTPTPTPTEKPAAETKPEDSASEKEIPPTPSPTATPPVEATTTPAPVVDAPVTEPTPTPVSDAVPAKADEGVPIDDEIERMMKRDAELLAKIEAERAQTAAAGETIEELKAASVPQPAAEESGNAVPVATEPTVPVPSEPVPTLSTGDLLGGGSQIPPTPAPTPVEVVTETEKENKIEEAAPENVAAEPPVEVPPVTEAPTPAPAPVQTEAPAPVEEVVTPAPTTEAPPPPVVEEIAIPDAVPEPVVEQSVPVADAGNAQAPPEVKPEEVTLPPLTQEVPPVTTEKVPEDPKPKETEEGYCDGDDCSRVSPPASSQLPADPAPAATPEQPAVPVQQQEHQFTSTAAPDLSPDDSLKAAPFEDNFSSGEPFVDMEALNNKSTGGPGFLGNVISSLTGVTRTILPLGDMSDAGVGLVLNLLFVLTALLIHLVSYFLTDSGDSVHFDRRIAHDLSTRCKQLQEQLKQKEEELHRVGANASRSQADADEIAALKLQLGPLQLEAAQLRERVARSEAEAAREKSDREGLERIIEKEREQSLRAEERASDAVREFEANRKHLEETAKELRDAKSALDRLEKELGAERSKAEELVTQADRADAAVKAKEAELASARCELQDVSDVNRQLKSELKAASDMLSAMEEQKKETDAVESGGSGGSGWSDFGDEPELEEPKEKTPPATDVREIIKMRAVHDKLQQDFEQARSSLEKELQEKSHLEDKLASVQAELERKTKEAEQRDAERKGADERANKLLSIIDGNNSKIRDTELTCDKLRDEVARCQSELLAVQEEKRKKEERVKELDVELKKLRHDFNRLETKSFHDVMEWKKKFEAAQLSQSIAANASTTFDMLNLSSGSADRENAPSRGGLPYESLWDEPSHRPSMGSRNRPLAPEDEFMPSGVSMPVVKKSSRSRRSMRDASPSDAEKRKEKKEAGGSRRRSRSHGRPMYMGPMVGGGPMPPYMGGPGYPPMYDPSGMSFGEPLNRRHSKSGHVYYSSGGSNGGRSPPPEMPLISAQPPPGTRRPSSKRATDLPVDFRSS